MKMKVVTMALVRWRKGESESDEFARRKQRGEKTNPYRSFWIPSVMSMYRAHAPAMSRLIPMIVEPVNIVFLRPTRSAVKTQTRTVIRGREGERLASVS